MRLIPQLCAALAIGLLGYWLGTRHASATRETQVVTVHSTSPTPKPGTKGTNRQAAGYQPGMAAELLAELDACDTDDDRGRLLTIRIHEMDHDHWPNLADELFKTIPFEGYTSIAFSEIITQWATLDPRAALAWAEQLPTEPPETNFERNRALVVIAEKLARVDAASSFKVLQNFPDSSKALSTVFKNWRKQDCNAAMKEAFQLERSQQSDALAGILDGWFTTDPKAALEACNQVSPGNRLLLQNRMLYEWGQVNPPEAFKWLASLPLAEQEALENKTRSISGLLSTVVIKDPTVAAKLVEQLPAAARMWPLRSVAEKWAAQDFEAAWKWANGLTSLVERNAALTCMGSKAYSQPTGTILKLANELTGEESSAQFLENCCRHLPYFEPEKLIQLFREMSPSQLNGLSEKRSLLVELARNTPRKTIDLLKEMPSLADDSTMETAVENYTDQEPVAAYEWAATHPEGEKFLAQTIIGLGVKDPSAALDKAQQLPNEAQRKSTLQSVFKQWAEMDFGEVQKALSTMSGQVRTLAQERVIMHQQEMTPSAAAIYLLQLQTSNRPEDVQAANSSAVIQQLASSWGEREPDAAINWIPKVPAGELREEFIQYLALSWTSQDTTKASQWVAGLPAGAEKDAAVIGMLGTIGGSDPEAAFAWAAQIGNADKRETGYAEVIQSLHKKSPETAKTALETAPISEKRKAELREALK